MTLLGKLFRPWDPSNEDDDNVISCEDTNKSKSVLRLSIMKGGDKRAHNFANSYRTPKFSERGSSSAVKVHQNSHKKTQMSKDSTMKERIKREHSASHESESNGSEQSRVTAQDVQSSIIGCCEPASPSEFDLYCNGSSFLYPNSNTLNELARLSRHELTAMGLLPPEPVSSLKVRRQRPKRFQCPHCQVAFSNNGQLRGHIRIHTGERPFVCEEEGCGKSFTRNEELTRHRRIHSGLRPFPCSYCGKKFGRKDHLKKHTRTHQRGVYNPRSAFVIGYANPFQPFHQNLLSSTPFATPNDLITLQSQYSSFSQQSQPLSTTTTSSSSSSATPASASATTTTAAACGSATPLLTADASSPIYPYPQHNSFLYHNTNYAMSLL